MESCYGEDIEYRRSVKIRIAIPVTAMHHVCLLIQYQPLLQPDELECRPIRSHRLLDLDAVKCLLAIGQCFLEDTIAL
jgi:hypothetical protein